MKKELLFITVIGKDKKGIVAKIASFLYRRAINIEDINQRITGGYFVMTMLVDIREATAPLEKISQELAKIGRSLEVSIQLQHENIFKMMHRV